MCASISAISTQVFPEVQTWSMISATTKVYIFDNKGTLQAVIMVPHLQ